jgi:hypothetical protein
MDRRRHQGYLRTRDAVAALTLDRFAAEILDDLAEGLLLARDAAEAEEACTDATDCLALLVDRGDVTRRAAARYWIHLRTCGPPMYWPPSWDRTHVAPPDWAVRGQSG